MRRVSRRSPGPFAARATRIALAASALLVAVGAAPADAYVPSGRTLLEKVAERLGPPRNLTVRNEVFVYRKNGTKSPERLFEIVHFKTPDGFYSRVRGEGTERILAVEGGRGASVRDGVLEAETEDRFDRYKDLFLASGATRLAERLSGLGVDAGVSSLGRLEGKIVYVVGAEYPDESASQLWLDKETFEPCRMILAAPETPDSAVAEGRLDIRYSDWVEIGGMRRPSTMEFFLDGELARRVVSADFAVDPEIDPKLFDPGRYLSQYPPSPPENDFAGKYEGWFEQARTAVERFGRLMPESLEPRGQ